MEERPREKLMRRGAASLDVTELLAIVLRTGSRSLSAVDLARSIYTAARSDLRCLANFSYEVLAAHPGVGKVKAVTVKAVTVLAALELARRLSTVDVGRPLQITRSSDVVGLMRPLLKDLLHEECWVLYLNRANRLIAKECMSTGGLTATVVDAKMIVRRALEMSASAVVLVHNHPSGEPYPGAEDCRQTKVLRDAVHYFDMVLLDHVIIAGDRYYSFSDEQQM